MHNNPNVSVIIPTYNRAELLKRAIDSVLRQTYNDYELIVVSDGSNDQTDKVVAAYTDPRIMYLKHEKPKGASATRNTGIRIAKGKYVAFLDDDDEWLPQKLEIQVPIIEKSSSKVGLIYAWMEYYENGKSIKIHTPSIKGNVFEEMLDKQAIGGCPTIIIKREVIERIGYFDEHLLRGNDGDYWRRITKFYNVDYVPRILAKINIDSENRISENTWENIQNAINGYKKRIKDFNNDFERHPIQKSNVFFLIAINYFRIKEYKQSIFWLEEAVSCNLNFICKKKLFFKYATQVLKISLKNIFYLKQ